MLPFAVFVVFLALQQYSPLSVTIDYPLRIVVLAAVLWAFSRDVIDLRCSHVLATILLGVAVFAIWVAPDILFPAYRQSLAFPKLSTRANQHQSARMSSDFAGGAVVKNNSRGGAGADPGGAVLAGMVDALDHFSAVSGSQARNLRPGGVLDHGGSIRIRTWLYWDVGLIAGIAYNWWMIRTKSLGDCILAHAVTNGCLCWYVVATHHWEYWN